MVTTTAETIVSQMVSSTGEILTSGWPFMYLFLGILIVLVAFSIIVKGFKYFTKI